MSTSMLCRVSSGHVRRHRQYGMSARESSPPGSSVRKSRSCREPDHGPQSRIGTANRRRDGSCNGYLRVRPGRKPCNRFARRSRAHIENALMATSRYCASSLDDTRAAFDSVAANYDGPRGNNDLIQDMRREMWRWLDASFPRKSHLIDLGCGTGLDAVRMAECGHEVLATDWSPRMVERTQGRAAAAGVTDRVRAAAIGGQELERIEGRSLFDGVYSNLGPLNCLPDLTAVSRECARLVRPGGRLVFTVI